MASGSSRPSRELPEAVLSFLTTDERIERCPPDPAFAARILDRVLSEEAEDTLHAAAQGRWQKANTYSYDGARKCVEAWLLGHGWRIRAAPGAHAAAVEIVRRWLSTEPDPGARIAGSFAAARKARHDDEYPSPTAVPRTDRELRALALDNVRLINAVRATVGAEVIDSILPTDAVLAARPER